MVNLFYKDYGRRPKMTEVDEAIQNGSLLANRAEVESLLLASKKSFWQTLSQYVVTHKVAASVLAVSCMTLLGGGAIFAWHSLHSQAQQTSSLRYLRQAVRLVKRLAQTSQAIEFQTSDSSSNSSSQSQSASSEAKTPAMDVDAIRNGDFQASKVTGFLTVVML
ncbi:MAG: hypothetical protein ACLTZB_01680 [Streptococcus salivarius]